MAGFGLYGKIPARGDFLRRNLPESFLAPWDAWLQVRIAEAREDLGSGWDHAYLTAPIWRFTLAPGLTGADAVVGVLMASVDRVGRQFPLTLAAPAGPGADAVALHIAAAAAFAALEEAALAALEDTASTAAIAAAVAALAVPEAAEVTARREGSVLVLVAADPAPALAAALAPWMRPSIWSAATDAGTLLFATEGLPDRAAFRSFLDSGAARIQAGGGAIPAETPA